MSIRKIDWIVIQEYPFKILFPDTAGFAESFIRVFDWIPLPIFPIVALWTKIRHIK